MYILIYYSCNMYTKTIISGFVKAGFITRPLIAEEQQAQLEPLNDLVGALERLGVVEEMEEEEEDVENDEEVEDEGEIDEEMSDEEEDDEDGDESADEEQRQVRQAEEMFVI